MSFKLNVNQVNLCTCIVHPRNEIQFRAYKLSRPISQNIKRYTILPATNNIIVPAAITVFIWIRCIFMRVRMIDSNITSIRSPGSATTVVISLL